MYVLLPWCWSIDCMYTQKCISCKHVEPLLNFFHGLYLLNVEKSHFYHNGAIFRVLIGRELCSIRRYRPWKWCDGGTICFFLSLACDFPRKFSGNGRQNCECYGKKKTSKTNVEMVKCCSRLNFLDELAHATPPLPTRELACSPGRVEESLLFLLTWLLTALGSPGWGVICDVYIFTYLCHLDGCFYSAISLCI